MPEKNNEDQIAIQVEGLDLNRSHHQTRKLQFTLENGEGEKYFHRAQIG